MNKQEVCRRCGRSGVPLKSISWHPRWDGGRVVTVYEYECISREDCTSFIEDESAIINQADLVHLTIEQSLPEREPQKRNYQKKRR